MSESPPKKIKSIPRYQREDAAWGRSKTYELIKSGDLQTVRIAGRQYVVMASHERLITPAAEKTKGHASTTARRTQRLPPPCEDPARFIPLSDLF